MRIALIGYGASGRVVAHRIQAGETGDQKLAAVLVREPSRYADPAVDVRFVRTIDELLATEPDLVAELAGHDALRMYGEHILRSGRTLLTISAGVFADDEWRERLVAAARQGGARLLLPSGAIGGLDAIAAAAEIGIDRVRHIVRKPPIALLEPGPAAEVMASGQARELYVGPAREAVRLFPANVNVVAMVSLAGVGFDRTEVAVIADPQVIHNTHEVRATGPFGSIEVRIQNVPSEDNPKTGVIVAGSIVRSLRRLDETLVVGA